MLSQREQCQPGGGQALATAGAAVAIAAAVALRADRLGRLELAVAAAVTGAVGPSHSCALLQTGEARCWGSNQEGQLGDGTIRQRGSPSAVVDLTDAIAIGAGAQHTCAVLAQGEARCWGLNRYGALGNGSFHYSPYR